MILSKLALNKVELDMEYLLIGHEHIKRFLKLIATTFNSK
jgi:hypothetical protein